MDKLYTLYTDGSYQKSLKIAAIGGYLLDENNNLIFEFSERIMDKDSFKYHESLALKYGLEKALQYGVKNIHCFSDDKSLKAIFNREHLTEESSLTNPVREAVFILKKQFSFIKFSHLPRRANKLADKLAGKYLKEHKDHITAQKTRQDFVGKEEQLIHVPEIICEEDFHDTKDLKQFTNLKNTLEFFYMFDILRIEQGVQFSTYLIHRNSHDFNDLKFNLMRQDLLPVKHFFVQELNIVTEVFNQSHNYQNIGLIFNHNEHIPFKRIDLVLRKRGLLHYPKTEGIQQFLDSCKNFTSIVLDNNEEIIHQLLSTNRNFKTEEQRKKSKQINEYLISLKQLSHDNHKLSATLTLDEPEEIFFDEFLKVSNLILKEENSLISEKKISQKL